MKHLSGILLVLLLSMFSIRADPSNGPFQFTLPSDWILGYQAGKETQVYTFEKLTNGLGPSMELSRWTAPGTREQMPILLDSMAKGFLEIIKKSDKVKVKCDAYTKGDFKAGSFSGNYITFTLDHGMIQIILMVSDGDGIWNGQYTGLPEQWAEALKILQSIKKKE